MFIRTLALLVSALSFSVNSFGLSLDDYNLKATSVFTDANSVTSSRFIKSETFEHKNYLNVDLKDQMYVQFSFCTSDDQCSEIGEPISVFDMPYVNKANEESKPMLDGVLGLVGTPAASMAFCMAFRATCLKVIGKMPALLGDSAKPGLFIMGTQVAGAAIGYGIGELTKDSVTPQVNDLVYKSTSYDSRMWEIENVEGAVNAISAYQTAHLNK